MYKNIHYTFITQVSFHSPLMSFYGLRKKSFPVEDKTTFSYRGVIGIEPDVLLKKTRLEYPLLKLLFSPDYCKNKKRTLKRVSKRLFDIVF